MELIRKTFNSDVKALKDERSLLVTISTPDVDRYGDIMVPTGAKLDNYLKNPVVLFGHNASDRPAIATAPELYVDDAGIHAKVKFPTEGKSQFADEVYNLYEEGIMRAWSIGFLPNLKTASKTAEGGFKIFDWELFEFSAVNIPANPFALTMMKNLGVSEETIAKLESDTSVAVVVTETEVKALTDFKFADDFATATVTFDESKSFEIPVTEELKKGLIEAVEAIKTGSEAEVRQEQLKSFLTDIQTHIHAKDTALLAQMTAMKNLLQPSTKEVNK
jgi:phage head maturation protease